MPDRVELQAESWIEVRSWLVGHGRIRVPGLDAGAGERVEVRLSLPSGMAVGFAGDVVDPDGGLVEVEAKGQGDLELLVHMAESEVDAERLATVLSGPPRRRAADRRPAGAAGTPTPAPRSREVIQPRKPRPSVVVPELDLAAIEPVARRVDSASRPASEELGLDGFAVELEPAPRPEPAAAKPTPAPVEARPTPVPQARIEPPAPAMDLEASLDFGSLDLGPPGLEPPPVDLGEPLELAPPSVDLGAPFELDGPLAAALEPDSSAELDSVDLGSAFAAPLAAPDSSFEADSVDLGFAAAPAEAAPDEPADDEFDVDLSSVDLPPAPLGPSLLDVRQVGSPALLVGAPADEPDEPLSGGAVLGIGFGSTRAEVAIVSGGKAFLATDEEENPGVPAKVQIPARDRQGKDVSIVVSGMKRLLGRRIDDPTNAGWLAQQPWRTTSVDGHVAVQLGGGAFAVPRLLAEVLKRLKLQAETALGDPATDTVIAVPLAYDAGQRAALRQAARLAGLRVVGLIAEPLATALAFGLGKARREVSLVFDLGGGSLEVTVLEGQGAQFRVLASVSDPWLGGDDFDRALATEILRGLDPIARAAVDQAGLIAACEVAKRALSSEGETTLAIPVLAGQPRSLKLDRARLAASCAGLLAQARVALDRVLGEAGVAATGVQNILLAGGMARAPLVRELVGERFGRAFTQVVGPEEAVALGAAIQGVAIRQRRR